MKHDWKKTDKQYYFPGARPGLVSVPPLSFFTLSGHGDPNDTSFRERIAVLYSLAYAVKMSPRNNFAPAGYYEYTVFPLEGIWDLSEEAKKANAATLDKSQLVYKIMIRQPGFVTPGFAAEAVERTRRKKYHPLLEDVSFETIEDGACIQMMHIGSYDSEPVSFRLMEEFCATNGYRRESKQHREIYLSDFRKTSPEKLKTVLRFRILK